MIETFAPLVLTAFSFALVQDILPKTLQDLVVFYVRFCKVDRKNML